MLRCNNTDIYFQFLALLLTYLHFLVRSRKSRRPLFQPWLHPEKGLLSHLWESLRVSAETSEYSHKLQSYRDRKLPTMPENCQKHLQLYSLQIHSMLFQWDLPATIAGAIWGNVTKSLLFFKSIYQWLIRHWEWRVAQATHHIAIFNSQSSLRNFCFCLTFHSKQYLEFQVKLYQPNVPDLHL